jgi:hypothetical protein
VPSPEDHLAGDRSPAASSLRRAGGIGLGLLLCTLASLARTLLGGTLDSKPTLSLLQEVWTRGLFFLGIALAGGLYLRALRERLAPSPRTLVLGALAIHGACLCALPLTSYDLFPNLAYGRLAQLGLNRYTEPPAALPAGDPFALSGRWRDAVTVYGPPLTWLQTLVASAGSRWAAGLLFKLLMSASALAAVLLVCRWGPWREHPAGRRALLFFAWNPLLAWEVSGQAHNDGPLLLLGCAFVVAALRQREWLAWAAGVTAFLTKLAFAPALGLYVLVVGRRAPWRARGFVLAAVVATTLALAPYWEGAATVSGPLSAARPHPEKVTNSLLALVHWPLTRWAPALADPLFAGWTWLTRAALLLLAGIYAWRTRTLGQVFRHALLFSALYLLLGTAWFLPWYALWLLPLALAVRDEGLRELVALYTVLVPALYLPADAGGLAILVAHGLPLLLLWRGRHLGRSADEEEEHHEENPVAQPEQEQAGELSCDQGPIGVGEQELS